MDVEPQRRPRGGQVKAPSERKRNNLTFRARDRLKAALETEAALNGRSLSEEIEARLEQSLLVQHLLTGSDEVRDANRAAVIHEAGAVEVRTRAQVDISGSARGNPIPIPLPKGRLPGDRTGAALEDLIERAVTRALERTGLAKDKPEKAAP